MKTNNNFTILIVDDEEINIELAALYLQEENYTILKAMNAQEALKILSRNSISLILLDINMPKVDGFKLCSMLKEEQKTKDIPIIFLTAQTDISYITKAFEVGGSDYLTKPFNALELKARVEVQIQNLAYLEDIKAKQSKLAQLSITDPLSKLHNRLFFDSQIKTFQNNHESFWILYIKINHFEKINNLYGFHNTNRLLKKFSTILKDSLFKNAVVAHLFSAHFAILTRSYPQQDMQKVYKNLIDNIKEDKNLQNSIELSSILLYNDKEKPLALPLIYKKIQTTLSDMQGNHKKLIVIK